MKIINEPIRVEPDPQRTWAPRHLEWNGRVYAVTQIVQFWKVQTHWWEKEVERLYIILATDGGLMEIYRQENTWTLYRLDD